MDAATGCLVTVFCHFPSPFHKPFPNDLSFPDIINILSTCLGLFIQQRLYIHRLNQNCPYCKHSKEYTSNQQTLFHNFFRLSVLVCLSDTSTLSKSLKLWKKRSFTYVIRFVSFPQMLVFQCILLIIYPCSFYCFGHSACVVKICSNLIHNTPLSMLMLFLGIL